MKHSVGHPHVFITFAVTTDLRHPTGICILFIPPNHMSLGILGEILHMTRCKILWTMYDIPYVHAIAIIDLQTNFLFTCMMPPYLCPYMVLIVLTVLRTPNGHFTPSNTKGCSRSAKWSVIQSGAWISNWSTEYARQFQLRSSAFIQFHTAATLLWELHGFPEHPQLSTSTQFTHISKPISH